MAKAQRRADRTDYGPRQRLLNGSAVLGYRADPVAPQAPAIRAARAFVAYEALHNAGRLSDGAREAADRLLTAAEFVSGAREGGDSGITGRAFWEYQGPGGRSMQAAQDLRTLRDVTGDRTAYCVMRLVADGNADALAEAIDGLETMAEFWLM